MKPILQDMVASTTNQTSRKEKNIVKEQSSKPASDSQPLLPIYKHPQNDKTNILTSKHKLTYTKLLT